MEKQRSWTGKRVLVTGGTSLLGQPLVEKLIERGAEVRVTTQRAGLRPAAIQNIDYRIGDLRELAFCRSIVEGIDAVFHLASFRRNVAYHLEHRDEVIAWNEGMTKSLLSALEGKAIPVVFFSTALVGTLPDETDPTSIPDGYLAAKVMCEELWTEAAELQGSSLLIVRPVNAYGPRDRFAADGNVIPALMVRCQEAEKELVVWGSGRQKRTFIYTSDVANATMHLLDAGAMGVQHLCPPECVSIRELAEMIRDLVRPGLPIRFDPSKPEGPDLCHLPMPEALKAFQWTELREGLRRTWEEGKSQSMSP